jgi:PAS domain S-box-containing protein
MKDRPVILVVDDQPQNLELLEAFLVPQGYEIVKAANGEEALGILSANQIDLMLLDVMMPGIDGFEVTRRVRQDKINRLLPIVLVTGLRETEDRLKGIDAGCDDFISKPLNMAELTARVRSLLKVKAYNDLLGNYQKELEAEVIGRTEELKQSMEKLQLEIIERKRVESVLLEAETRYRLLFERSPDGIVIVDPATARLLEFNESACRQLGYSNDEFANLSIYDIDADETPEGTRARISKVMSKDNAREDFETHQRNKAGEIRDVHVTAQLIEILGRPVYQCIWRDITDRKRMETELKQSEERYRSIFENAQEGIFRSTPEGKIIMANHAMAKMFGYETPEEMMTSITDVARQHYMNSEDRRKIEETIEEHGFIKEQEVQNYRKDGTIIWISGTMQAVRDEKGQIMYYDGMTEDITIRKESAERIRKALGATVQAIAVTVETRDPYTAGHQRRTADLAQAIAEDMKLSPDRIEGIRVSSAIHDLGKISVPAEILSKPTKLTELEFSLIKTHSQSGYDILKDIEFPWAIARIVLEHHERMNGSGYPNGLSGDSILVESRILAVADVVESMASHRPYRPALGIDAALEEIEKNRRTLYDDTVVDSCLKLFRVKGFQLKAM